MYQYIFVKCTYLTETSKLREYSCRLRFEWLVQEHDVLTGLLCPRSPIIGSSKYFFKCFENFIRVKWIFPKILHKNYLNLVLLAFFFVFGKCKNKGQNLARICPCPKCWWCCYFWKNMGKKVISMKLVFWGSF